MAIQELRQSPHEVTSRVVALLLALVLLFVSSSVLCVAFGFGITSSEMRGNPNHAGAVVHHLAVAADRALLLFLLITMSPALLIAHAAGSMLPRRRVLRWLASYILSAVAGNALALAWLFGGAPDPVWALKDLLEPVFLR